MVLFQCLWKIEVKLSDVTDDISEMVKLGAELVDHGLLVYRFLLSAEMS